MIANEHQLDDALSTPSAADIEAMRVLQGDLILIGVAGKMGPSLALRARRASEAAGVKRRITGVSRFTDPHARQFFEHHGIETVAADIAEMGAARTLPDAENVIYLVGRKFGSTGSEEITWGLNVFAPGLVAERYRDSRIVAFSSGNVYPLMPLARGGATEQTPPAPVGEYGITALGRERIFHFFSRRYGTPVTLLRLNYAIDLRYGVLLDIGAKVFGRKPVPLGMGHVNVIWQGDANSVCLRSFSLCESPPAVLNVTGPETASVRWIAQRFAEKFGVDAQFEGEEGPSALLNNASRCQRLFGYPSVGLEQLIEWTAQWIGMGGHTLDKPTHFETTDGQY